MINLLKIFKKKKILCNVRTKIFNYKDVDYESINFGFRYLEFNYKGTIITVPSETTIITMLENKDSK